MQKFSRSASDVVDWTLAVQRIEGWQPSSEHVAALAALASGSLSFGDYLDRFRARHPPPSNHRRRPGLRRSVPYYIPGTTLLRNNFGATSIDVLTDLEFVATAGRMVQWLCRPPARLPSDGLDVRVIHQHLFADVYSWAGSYRTTELRRGNQGFAWQSTIAAGMAEVHRVAHSILANGVDYDASRLAYDLARLYADYNHLHPFREGNGRTGALFLQTVAAACGKHLDLTGVDRDEWYSAASDSMPFRRDGRASHRPFLYALNAAVTGSAS